jgi:hypothetical protein
VIAQQRDDAAAPGSGLWLEGHQQVQHRPHVGAAVGVVARLDQRGGAAGPPALGVDQIGFLEDGDKRLERAVNVTNGDNSWHL